jgi:hypothetical protein
VRHALEGDARAPALEAPSRNPGCSRPPILVLPGFLASDLSTKPFREALMRAAGKCMAGASA